MQPLTLVSTAPTTQDAMRSERLEALRGALRRRFPAALPAQEARAEGVPTGAATLDLLLPGDGLPRGKITEWACARSGGSATLLRALVRGALSRGEAVAMVDASRSLAAADWVEAARAGELTVVRPPTPEEGPFCAELLLDAGAFALVVLDGAGLPPRIAPRLAHRVREAGCAFLVVLPDEGAPREGSNAAALRIALAPLPAPPKPLPEGPRPATSGFVTPRPSASPNPHPRPPLPWAALPRIVASLVKGAAPGHTELCCVVPTPDRLCAHPLIPDRRGGARHGRSW